MTDTGPGHTSPAIPRKRPLKSLFYAVAVFLSGIVVGMSVMFHFHPNPMRMPPIPEHAPEDITKMLRRDLGLDDEQAKAVLEVMKKDREVMEGIRKRGDSEMLEQLETTQGLMHQILRPEQSESFDKRFEHLKAQFRPNAFPGSDAPAP